MHLSGRRGGRGAGEQEQDFLLGRADVMKGIFTERGHELENCSFKDKILVFQSTKGSSGTSGMLKWSKINGVVPEPLSIPIWMPWRC